MASSEHSFESDADFWQQLEDKPDLNLQMLSLPCDFDDLGDLELPKDMSPLVAYSTIESVKKQHQRSRPATVHDERSHRRVEKSMSIIEGAKHVEATNVTIVVKSAAQRELEIAVFRLKEELEKNLCTLEEAYDDLNVLLSKKDSELGRTMKILETHKTALEQAGIKPQDARFLKAKRPLLPWNYGLKPSDRIKQEVDQLKLQVQSLSDIADMYRVDRDGAVANRNRLMKEKEELIKHQQEEIEAVGHIMQAEEAESEAKKKNMLDELEEFKYEVSKEMEIRSLLIKRQQDQIDRLKLELTTAKSVLKNPRLKKVAYEIISKNTNRSASASRRSSINQSFSKHSVQQSQLYATEDEPPKPPLPRPQTSKASASSGRRSPLIIRQAPEEANSGVLHRMLPAHLKLSR
mmetsp:Transcript_18425/g.33184  ORF Transcript_18425/g.33184 Transcript_18425/m.33184 type:complete len:406 (+) Transcript_18425:19-1236(+)